MNKPAELPVPGDLFQGKYRIERLLGKGGMGAVFSAQHEGLGQRVAVKFLLAEAAANEEANARFRQEARAAANILNEHVARVVDVDVSGSNGLQYMVMEYLEGQDLSQLLETRASLPPDEACGYLLQAADAIHAAHKLGIIHRDLKPSNLFLARDDDGHETIKIIDFGIARVEWEEMRITNLGAPMGTPGYMAPEQEAGADVDARADLYSLGATFYECLVGEPPNADATGKLQAVTPERSAAAVGSGVHKSAQSLPPEWHEVLGRCLARSPDDRFQDARSLARALRALRAVPAASLSS